MNTKTNTTQKSVKSLNPCPQPGFARSRWAFNPWFRLLSTFYIQLLTVFFLLSTVVFAQPESLTISPQSLDFGEVRLGESADLPVNFGNSGNGVIDVTDIIPGTDQLSVFPVPFSVNPGGTQPITVTFTPTAEGTFLDTLTIFSTDNGDPEFDLPVTGTAIAEPIINVSTEPLQFDVVVFDDTLATQTLTIENTGYDTLEVSLSSSGGQGYALAFDGSNYISSSNLNQYYTDQPLSISGWFKYNGSTNNYSAIIQHKGTGSNGEGWMLGFLNDNLRWFVYDYPNMVFNNIITDFTIQFDQWYFFSWVTDGYSFHKLFINGELIDEQNVGFISGGNEVDPKNWTGSLGVFSALI